MGWGFLAQEAISSLKPQVLFARMLPRATIYQRKLSVSPIPVPILVDKGLLSLSALNVSFCAKQLAGS